jgi:tryptophanase
MTVRTIIEPFRIKSVEPVRETTRDEEGVEQSRPMDQLRLAIPRRLYTQSHIDYVAETVLAVWRRREQIRGRELSFEAPSWGHFTAPFRRVS